MLRRLSSPVFFSTLDDGRVVQGFGGVPTNHRPILFVGNHQTYAPDLGILVGEFLQETGVLMRGLAHPMAMGMVRCRQSRGAQSQSGGVRFSGARAGPASGRPDPTTPICLWQIGSVWGSGGINGRGRRCEVEVAVEGLSLLSHPFGHQSGAVLSFSQCIAFHTWQSDSGSWNAFC